jgi:hypothetical protein
MIIGIHSRDNDLMVNPTKGKKLTNIRSAGADENIIFTPPIKFSLEQALEFIDDDELVEVTPTSIRLRKKLLPETSQARRQFERLSRGRRDRDYRGGGGGANRSAASGRNRCLPRTGLDRRRSYPTNVISFAIVFATREYKRVRRSGLRIHVGRVGHDSRICSVFGFLEEEEDTFAIRTSLPIGALPIRR